MIQPGEGLAAIYTWRVGELGTDQDDVRACLDGLGLDCCSVAMCLAVSVRAEVGGGVLVYLLKPNQLDQLHSVSPTREVAISTSVEPPRCAEVMAGQTSLPASLYSRQYRRAKSLAKRSCRIMASSA
jgi:hypothetical protein